MEEKKDNDDFEFEDQRKDEEVIFLCHQHPWVLAKLGLISVFLIGLVLLSFLIFGMSKVSITVLVTVSILIVIYAVIRTFIYKNSLFVLTNYRVINIIQSSLFRRKVQETELENIYNLQYDIDGPIKSFLNFGNIELTTQGDKTNLIKFYNIENPHFIHEKISDARRRAMDRNKNA